ncbi:F-ATPase subunit 6 [Anaerohalosphaera lusitana]|uniref:ATP synthase subunit a n=1 Tax=Anaerohalosphaera lusitana TaxID=1936003 RepID=A0A1U9NNB4_9BACT|nr:F0F1 ATP synthase subunit A [Anaerohalosphaera lusitana]AQT69393.1 F-ATPase subunit 6 [Anaerohalosphaera lusitana]
MSSGLQNILASTSLLDHVASKDLFTIGAFRFTNHMLMMTLAVIGLCIVMPLAIGRRKLVRKGFGNAIEAICLYLREEVARPFLGEKTDKYIGFIWTMFFFILTMNLFGLIPMDRIIFFITDKQNHYGGTATGNIWITGALASISFVTFHWAGIRENGLAHYFKSFIPKVPWPLIPLMYLMETISSFVRVFALAIRLYANMLAGHILLGVLIFLIILFKNYLTAFPAVPAYIAFSILELFVAFLQAYIFTFLTTIFIGFAVFPEH